jgi:filamentous hemagglutinin family protein
MIVLRIGRRRLTLSWRPRKRIAALLARLLNGMWRSIFGVLKLAAATASGAAFAAGPVLTSNALPTGAQLVAGQASISQTLNAMNVVQGSDKAILNWNTFNIGSGAIVNFQQPTTSSVILNRVTSNDPSQLLGTLTGNGKVFLINPAGIMVGQGARVDVGAFVASTLAMRDEDFLAGRLNFQMVPNAGMVQNYGSITTPSGGSVYLIAPNVENYGIIHAPNGEVILAAGQTVELLDTGTPGVKVEITGAEGNVTNLGSVISEAGRIGMAGVLVKNSGTLNASSVVSEGGRIFLRAKQGATVDQDAVLSATGTRGGNIDILGDSVTLKGTASLDVSGLNGGGTLLVGGDYQGKNSAIQNARITDVVSNVNLRADATQNGNGGRIIVWADDSTHAAGNFSARGGMYGGDGGLVETSGKATLSVSGIHVDTQAPQGKIGTLLLDPKDLYISDTGAVTIGGGVSLGYPDTVTDLTIKASGADSLSDVLTTTNVSLAAANNILVNSAVTSSGNHSLTMAAGNDILVNAPISNSGDVTLSASDVAISGYTSVGRVSLNANVSAANLTITTSSATAKHQLGGNLTAAALSITGKSTLATDNTWTLSGNSSISSPIDGSYGLTFNGAGTTSFTASNSYTGATIVSSGTLGIGATNAITASDITVTSGGTLALGNFSNTTSGSFTTTGTVTTGGSGSLTAASYTVAGGTVSGNLGSGTLNAAGAGTLNGTFAGSTLNVTGTNFTLGAADRLADSVAITVQSGASINFPYAETIGSFSNAGLMSLSGPLTISSGNSMNVHPTNGTLDISSTGGQLILGSGTTFTNPVNGIVTSEGSNANPITGSGIFNNAGTLWKTQAGTQIISITDNQSTGQVKVTNGTLMLKGLTSDINNGSIDISSGATLSTYSGNLTNSGSIAIGSGATLAPWTPAAAP